MSNLYSDEVAPILGFSGEYRFLSNFWKCWVTFDGKMYGSTEHAYQAAKFQVDDDRFPDNWKTRDYIRFAKTPNDAKKLGQGPGKRDDWEEVKEDFMREFLMQKFSQPELMEQLLATGDAYLEETNHWGDRYWGVDGTGKNRLGYLLMEIRRDLRQIAANR